jgi:uncharacterized radical SAM superfamily protein
MDNKEKPLTSKTVEEVLANWITWDSEIEDVADKIFITKAMEEYASQQTEALQAEIERLKERHEKDITALLHLGMVKDEQIERLKNIIKRWKT